MNAVIADASQVTLDYLRQVLAQHDHVSSFAIAPSRHRAPPIPPSRAFTPIYLIDRQPFDWSLTVWLGVSDQAGAGTHQAFVDRHVFYDGKYLGVDLRTAFI